MPPTSIPEPRCAPSTGPTSVQNSGSVPKIACPRRRGARRRRRLGVLHDPVARAAVVQLAQVGDHPLERAAVRPHAPDGSDLGAERQDRLDLQRRADHRLGGADAPATAQVLERVEAEPDVERLARPLDGGDDRVRVAPRSARLAASSTRQPRPPAPVCPSITSTLPAVLRWQQPCGFARALAGARQAAGDVDRDHVAPGAAAAGSRPGSPRPTAARWSAAAASRAGARRRHRGRRTALGAQIPVPADVQAHLLDPPALDQRGGQIGRAVGDDRHLGRGSRSALGVRRSSSRSPPGPARSPPRSRTLHPRRPDRLAQRLQRVVSRAPAQLAPRLARCS